MIFLQRGYSPLMEAADRNHVDVVRVFIEHCDTEVDGTDIPTLVSSNSSNNSHRAYISQLNTQQNEAFLLAVEKGHTDIVQLLHRCGASTSTVTEVSFFDFVNPLYTLY